MTDGNSQEHLAVMEMSEGVLPFNGALTFFNVQ
jgi:hypothetical protein